MANRYFLAIVFFIIWSSVSGQKPVLDTSSLGKWPDFLNIKMANNGEYACYIQADNLSNTSTLHVVSNISDWKLALQDIRFDQIVFSENSRLLCFKNAGDSLGIVELGKTTIRYFQGVRSFTLSASEKEEWIAILGNNAEKTLNLQSLITGKKREFTHVSDYIFSKDGSTLLFQTDLKKADSVSKTLVWVDLPTGEDRQIWEGKNSFNYGFDDASDRLAFMSNENNPAAIALYYIKKGMTKAICLLNNLSAQIANNKILEQGEPEFSRKGDKILFSLVEKVGQDSCKKASAYAGLNIWSYRDEYLQSEQLSGLYAANFNINRRVQVIMDLKTKRIIQLTDEKQHLEAHDGFEDYFVAVTDHSPSAFYKNEYRPSMYLVSANDGSSKAIVRNTDIDLIGLSPDEKYLVWFNPDSLCYFSYETTTGVTRNISNNVPKPLYDEEAVNIGRPNVCYGLAGWDGGGDAIYLYDKYDLWKVDLSGVKSGMNITNGYGRRKRIVFGLLNDPTVIRDETLILSGFNSYSKDNGFWQINLKGYQDPICKTMGSYCYYIGRTGQIGNIAYAKGNIFIKAKNANKFLVQRMSAGEFPNIYYSGDLKSFHQISDLEPEKKYVWLTAELIHWKMTDGNVSQGILYKPENFDSTKKYPVVFNYYEKWSDRLHQYIAPEFIGDLINVPYYVSNGYIMFIPDIYFTPQHNGESVVNAVVSAAKYLSTFSWIDSTKLGIQGHSFGGWETNYLITHTNIFAAACEGAGASDLLSSYNQLQHSGIDRQEFYETDAQGSPYGKGVTPWTRPEAYFENSPVFYVNHVTTPLLMMHGDADDAVPYNQALEMFLALRRAEKKVWLLQYERSNHALDNQAAVDYTIRMRQFFDYYLKDVTPPKWMTESMPAAKKGIDPGYETDISGRQP